MTRTSQNRKAKLSRFTALVAAIGMVAALSGCVVYPDYGPGRGGGYYHHGYWR